MWASSWRSCGPPPSRIALEVPHLLADAEVGEHDLVAVEADPDDRDLWRAIGVERHQMGESSGLQQCSG
jgi:hypothetical protein